MTLRSVGRISVVIPTLNEAERLPALLATLAREPELAETIVADGGSAGGTGAMAERLGALVVSAERGRGHQLRAGAAVASSEILLGGKLSRDDDRLAALAGAGVRFWNSCRYG